MTNLRKKMIEDMKLAGLAQRTQETYVYAVSRLAQYYDRSPQQITDKVLQSIKIICCLNSLPSKSARLKEKKIIGFAIFSWAWFPAA